MSYEASHSVFSNFPPTLRPYIIFYEGLFFYGEVLAPFSTSKLEDHPLSALCDCIFNILAAVLHIYIYIYMNYAWIYYSS